MKIGHGAVVSEANKTSPTGHQSVAAVPSGTQMLSQRAVSLRRYRLEGMQEAILPPGIQCRVGNVELIGLTRLRPPATFEERFRVTLCPHHSAIREVQAVVIGLAGSPLLLTDAE